MNNSHIPKSDPLPVPLQPEPRQSWKPWLWIAGCLLSFLAGRFLLPASHHAEERLSIAKSNHHHTPGDAIVVTTEPVTTRTLDRTVEAVGTLYGFEEVEISSKLDGTVAKIHYDLSSVVKPGDVLLELDSTDASLALDQAQRSLQAELSKCGFASVPDESYDRNQLPMVVSAKLRLDLARSRLERMLPLELTRSISADDLEQAKSETRIAESEWKNQLLLANSAAANARLKAADLAIAMQRLKDCQICVPNPTLTESDMPALYTVSERMVSEGTHVRPSSVVFRIVLGRTLKLRLSIPEVHASSLAIDQRVQITTSASSEFQWGRVAKISPAIDRALCQSQDPHRSQRQRNHNPTRRTLFLSRYQQDLPSRRRLRSRNSSHSRRSVRRMDRNRFTRTPSNLTRCHQWTTTPCRRHSHLGT